MQYRQSTAWVAGLLTALILCVMSYILVEGEFVKQMILHIALMGPIACLIATWLIRFYQHPVIKAMSQHLWLATCVQLAAFLLFHLPFNLHAAHQSSFVMLGMFAILLGAAVWFWSCTFCMYQKHYWQSILALLITAKVFCLVAVLMIFAPRPLYGSMQHMIAMNEQQLAGLVMVVACPMSYILAAIILCVRWLNAISSNSIVHFLEVKDA